MAGEPAMTADEHGWDREREAEWLAAIEDPARIRFEIVGRSGAVFSVSYDVHPGQRARIVSTLEHHHHEPDMVEQFAMDKPVRTDVAIPQYLLMVYGIECVPDGEDFPDQPGEPDE